MKGIIYQTFHLKSVTLLAAVISLLVAGCDPHPKYDVLITHAHIHSPLDELDGELMWIGITDGKIAKLGNMESELPNAEQYISAHYGHLYPGFNDAHGHLFGYARTLATVNLVGTTSLEDCLERIRKFVQQHPDQLWITGRGWDQNDWPTTDFPSADDLAEFKDHFVYLNRIDGHAAWVNQRIMDEFGLIEGMEISGGQILDGVLVDRAEEWVEVPDFSRSRWTQLLLQAQDSLLAYGLTGLTDAGLPWDKITLLDSLMQAQLWHLPLNVMVSNSSKDLKLFFEHGPIESPLLRVASVKAYLDGALGSRGALLRAPYHDLPDHYGLSLMSLPELDSLRDLCVQRGVQLCVHAIGDSAHHVLLRSFQNLPHEDLRFRVEHAQIMTPQDSAYYAHPAVVPSIQPTHATSDMYWAQDRLGEHRIHHAYSYKRLLNAAGVVALGTDFPIERIDPRATFASAVFRQDVNGYPTGGFEMDQRLTAEEAIVGMTYGPAFASFGDANWGRIKMGQSATFTIVERDMKGEDVKSVTQNKILKTIVLGKELFSNQDVISTTN